MTIHTEHPFATPEPDRSPARRFRARLVSPVSLWTSGQGRDRRGLTVSSLLVGDGDPGWLLGVIDPLSDLHDALVSTGTAAVTLLDAADHHLADQFGFVAPAPGGVFASRAWHDTEWGPVLDEPRTWAGARLAEAPSEFGWGVAVRLRIEHVELADSDTPLAHRRGRYLGV